MVRSKQMEDRLCKVGNVEIEVDQILQRGDVHIHNRCFTRYCPKTCKSSYKLGKKAVKYLGIVKKMRDRGQFDVVGFEGPSISGSRVEQKTKGFKRNSDG